MTARSTHHQHRHFKTLILLVVSMTTGAFLLSWADQMAPSQRRRELRSMTPGEAQWRDIQVRSIGVSQPRGFFHFRIDDAGRLFQSSAWRNGTQLQDSQGTIHILLTQEDLHVRPNSSQQRALEQILSQIRAQLQIPADHVRVATGDRLD